MAQEEVPSQDPALPATAYAVLGLLSFGQELTGYDLRKWAMNLRYFYWSPAQSQIYLELRRLLQHGLVEVHLEEQKSRPDKRLYRITDAGLKVFREWLDHAPVGPPLLKHSVALRLFFGHQTNHGRLREVLTEYRDWAVEQTSGLTQLRTELDQALPYPALVATWGSAYFAAEITAIDTVLADLDRMEAGPREQD
ncbi:PadR family transcriptional regulator [Lentzea albidocapillata]|uniref:Virulence activator alpha C-term n=2 Tax=Lentzea albidocapillata TaxID=40571 RepID=A0A1W1ZTS7_9PSEU|nr:PadR family transcriptional regulator [Lentzea albidocapillata]SDJ45220.1 transcriptional regulator, PadR family [Lentzea albidocapillata subsp. violacea]SMC51468.1 Virulence activator alpha C-term [Lentzea albidocapillata]